MPDFFAVDYASYASTIAISDLSLEVGMIIRKNDTYRKPIIDYIDCFKLCMRDISKAIKIGAENK